jgi:hypothetical protein
MNLYESAPMQIGKHGWRAVVKPSPYGVYVIEYQWRTSSAAQWRTVTEWPRWNGNDTYCGLPKSLATLYRRNQQAIQHALQDEPDSFSVGGQAMPFTLKRVVRYTAEYDHALQPYEVTHLYRLGFRLHKGLRITPQRFTTLQSYDRFSRFAVWHGGEWLPLVYDKRFETIVTCLLKEVLLPYKGLLRW